MEYSQGRALLNYMSQGRQLCMECVQGTALLKLLFLKGSNFVWNVVRGEHCDLILKELSICIRFKGPSSSAEKG